MLFLLQVASELMNDHLTFHTDFPSFSLLPFFVTVLPRLSPYIQYKSAVRIPLNSLESQDE